MFLRYVHLFLKNHDEDGGEIADEEGMITLPRTGINHIVLAFEFSPERVSAFDLDATKNNFEFRMDRFITEVFFKNFSLRICDNGLEGKHPLLDDRKYIYKRGNE